MKTYVQVLMAAFILAGSGSVFANQVGLVEIQHQAVMLSVGHKTVKGALTSQLFLAPKSATANYNLPVIKTQACGRLRFQISVAGLQCLNCQHNSDVLGSCPLKDIDQWQLSSS